MKSLFPRLNLNLMPQTYMAGETQFLQVVLLTFTLVHAYTHKHIIN